MKPTETLNSLARRAKLILSDEEAEMLERDIGEMIAFADRLATAPVTDAQEETAVPCAREDHPRPSMERELLLASANGVVDGYITVPQVLREDEYA